MLIQANANEVSPFNNIWSKNKIKAFPIKYKISHDHIIKHNVVHRNNIAITKSLILSILFLYLSGPEDSNFQLSPTPGEISTN